MTRIDAAAARVARKKTKGSKAPQTNDAPAVATLLPKDATVESKAIDLLSILFSERFNREEIDETSEDFLALVESIKQTGGVLEPILVRPHPPQKLRDVERYELVAGERRYRATKAAGFDWIHCVVRELTDQQAAECQFTENFHRSDLSPYEEARQVKAMLEAGWSTAELAAHLGKTQRWVQRRASITNLSPKWANAVREPKKAVSKWPAAALEAIAKLPPESQDELMSRIRWLMECHEIPDIKDIDRYIGEMTRELKKAPWKLDDALLLPTAGACKDCPKRSGAHPELWNGSGERCLDPECWQQKAAAAVDRRRAELKEKYDNLILIGHYGTKGCVDKYSVRECKKTAKGARPALVVEGPDAGRHYWVEHNGHRRDFTAGPTPLKERRKQLELRRTAWIVRAVRRRLEEADVEHLTGARPGAAAALLRLVAAFGAASGYDDDWKGYAKVARLRDGALWAEAWVRVRERLVSVLTDGFAGDKLVQPDRAMQDAEAIAELLSIDLEGLADEAVREIPEPKSWANLNPDGTPKDEKKAKPLKKAKAK